MTKSTNHPRFWTADEDEVLRFQWQSGQPVKTWMHLLPGRSSKAIQQRGNALGLPARGNGRTPGNSPTWVLIQQILADGSMFSPLELAKRIGVARHTIYTAIRLHYPAHIHVGGYGPQPEDGVREKLWKLGPGKDAQRPPATPKAVRAHRRWIEMKKNDPEAVAKHYAKNRHYFRQKAGNVIKRDPAAAWI